MGMHTEITAAGPALAAVEAAIVAEPTAQQTFEAADADNRPRRSDEEVIAWLGARNIIPPFTADFLDEIRSQMDGLEWVRKVSEIRKDPDRMIALVAIYRENGLEGVADDLERLRLDDLAWAERTAESEADLAGLSSVYILPNVPAGISPTMRELVESYRSAYFANDDDGDDGDDRWGGIASAIEAHSPLNDADIAARLIVGLHYAYPSQLDDRLAVDVDEGGCPTAGRMLISGIKALVERVTSGTLAHTRKAELPAGRAA